MRLKNKIAFIPGGTAGIGKSIALGFIGEGAQVVVASRGAERVRQMEELFTRHGMSGLSLQLDITDQAAVVACTERILERYGRIDIMCCTRAFSQPPLLWISAQQNGTGLLKAISAGRFIARRLSRHTCAHRGTEEYSSFHQDKDCEAFRSWPTIQPPRED